jgi:tRNA dimethylallyltransferase
MKPQLIVIQGPTASGKTALAIALAKKWNTVVLSADSRQFYKEVSIGTAKPNEEEMDGIPHYFINSHSLEEPVSAAQFEKEAVAVLEKQFLTHQKIIMVGGSGLFIDAVLYGLDNFPSDKVVQQKWQNLLEEKGLEYLQEQMKLHDPKHFEGMDIANPHRLIRGLEIMELSGEKLSELRKHQVKERFFDYFPFVLNPNRDRLYARINERVHHMVDAGLKQEVEAVKHLRHLQSLNTVGYKEVFQFMDGEFTWEKAIEMIQQNSRRYAKRQLTWFRRKEQNIWIDYESLDERISFIEKKII